jgi:hypothetical protein
MPRNSLRNRQRPWAVRACGDTREIAYPEQERLRLHPLSQEGRQRPAAHTIDLVPVRSSFLGPGALGGEPPARGLLVRSQSRASHTSRPVIISLSAAVVPWHGGTDGTTMRTVEVDSHETLARA